MNVALLALAIYVPLCSLCGFLFYTGHPVAGAWVIVALNGVSVKSTPTASRKDGQPTEGTE